MDFIKNYLTWKHPLKYYNKVENCFVLNFGSQQKIKGLAIYSVELDSDFNSERMNNIHEHEAVDNCFLAFIEGKYVQDLDQVVEKMETISKKIGLYPLGLFMSVENHSHNIQFTNFVDGVNFPLVSKVVLYYTGSII